MADAIWAEDLERIAEELGVEHEDFERLQTYVSLVRSYPIDNESPDGYIRENIEKWIEWETETYFGEHESPAKFAEFYYSDYSETTVPSWVVIDWDATWDRNLRHDFHFENTADYLGHVWAEVY